MQARAETGVWERNRVVDVNMASWQVYDIVTNYKCIYRNFGVMDQVHNLAFLVK